MLGRKIVLERTYKRLLDTTFAFMCEEARSSVDYLELVKHFDVIVLRDIPFISLRYFDVLRRFIVFIDTIYDNRVKLLCSGKASSPQLLFDIDSMNTGNNTSSERSTSRADITSSSNDQTSPEWLSMQTAVNDVHFSLDRTVSRLIEMQSENYHKNSVFVVNNTKSASSNDVKWKKTFFFSVLILSFIQIFVDTGYLVKILIKLFNKNLCKFSIIIFVL